MRRSCVLVLVMGLPGLAAGACATLGSPPGGDQGLPSADMGPFRAITTAEESNNPPFVLVSTVSQLTEPSALAVDPSDRSSLNVYLYAVSTPIVGSGVGPSVIVRSRAEDARSFYGSFGDPKHSAPPVVLSASLPWEGPSVAGPSVIRVGAAYYLYYAAAGGIGLARSADGLKFEKMPMPVLATDPAASWEITAPFAPSVAVLPDGTFDMMYSAGVSIGEATSLDGISFTRQDADPETPELDPVFTPLRGAGTVADGAVAPFDTGQVSDPCVLPRVSPAARLVTRVLYTGYDRPPGDGARSSAIGFAARYGTTGRLTRQPLPSFSISMQEAAPTYVEWAGGELLYVQAHPGPLAPTMYLAIILGVAPPTIMLGPANANFAPTP
jgi:hypothetical protein